MSCSIRLAASHRPKKDCPGCSYRSVRGIGAYAYGTCERNNVWHEPNESLWRDVTEKSPKNGRGLMNYGLALMARADYAGAEKYFSDALRLTPNYSYLFINMGILKAATGKPGRGGTILQEGRSGGPQ